MSFSPSSLRFSRQADRLTQADSSSPAGIPCQLERERERENVVHARRTGWSFDYQNLLPLPEIDVLLTLSIDDRGSLMIPHASHTSCQCPVSFTSFRFRGISFLLLFFFCQTKCQERTGKGKKEKKRTASILPPCMTHKSGTLSLIFTTPGS